MFKISKKLLASLLAILAFIIVFQAVILYTQNLSLMKEERDIQELSLKIEDLNIRLQQLNDSFIQLKIENEKLKQVLKESKLKRPSYEELKKFLEEDDVNFREYTKGYVCINYARDLKIHAERMGLNISFIIVNFNSPEGEMGHGLNGAYLSNGEFVYIEPQTDKIYFSIEEALKDTFDLEWVEIEGYAIVW